MRNKFLDPRLTRDHLVNRRTSLILGCSLANSSTAWLTRQLGIRSFDVEGQSNDEMTKSEEPADDAVAARASRYLTEQQVGVLRGARLSSYSSRVRGNRTDSDGQRAKRGAGPLGALTPSGGRASGAKSTWTLTSQSLASLLASRASTSIPRVVPRRDQRKPVRCDGRLAWIRCRISSLNNPR